MIHAPPRRSLHGRRPSGFTLMELMIVVAVIAILARLALPSYAEYVLRGQLPEAFSYLSDYQLKMEQFYQDNRNYGTAGGTACATGTNPPAWNTFVPSGARYFTFSCALGADNQSYTLTATGGGGRTAGYTYTVNSGGVKATTQFAGSSVSKACWASRATDC